MKVLNNLCEYQATAQSNLTQHNEKGVKYACYELDSSIGLLHHIRARRHQISEPIGLFIYLNAFDWKSKCLYL